MKYFVIFLVLIGFTVLFGNQVYGIWFPQSPQELLEESQMIFVGNISSVRTLEFERSTSYNTEENGVSKTVIENYTLPLDEYTVNVEESVKNTQIAEVITVRQPTISTPGRVLPFEGFEVGDRVLFYIKEFDGTNTYSKESFPIPKQCDSFSVITKPRMIGSDYTMMQNGVEKEDNFTANYPIQFIAKSDMGTLSGASLEYDVFISKQVGKIYKERVFNQTITADAKPCEWLSVAEWEFMPDVGNYLLNGRIYENGNRFPIGNKFFSVMAEAPLKQIQSGIPFNEIQCKENLILLQKYDGSPACVTESTKLKLIERGWTEKIIDMICSKHAEISDVEKLLIENKINYIPDKLVITTGATIRGDPACGAVVDTDSKVHWFGIDSISNPREMTLYDENPNQCVVNTSSCFCNAQIKLSALTLDELDYFTPQEQEKYANILIGYLYEENINRTPKFMIGKHNVNYTDPSAIGYCGKIWGTATRGYFNGAIVDGEVKDYGIDKELPLLCAISDNAQYFGKAFGE